MELTRTNVRYLLTIYHLSRARLEVSSKDIARSLEANGIGAILKSYDIAA